MSETPSSNLPPLACVVLAAGQGTRMRSDLPKVLHPVAGLPMIGHVLNTCAELNAEKVVVVIGPEMPLIEKAVLPHRCVIQPKPLGTGDAVKAARSELESFKGDVVVLFGDGPMVTAGSIRRMQKKRRDTGAAVVVAGFQVDDPGANGRLIVDDKGELLGIVEATEVKPDQNPSKLCNGGMMMFDGSKLWGLLDQITDNNAKKEFYLTDCVELARKGGSTCAVVELPVEQVACANSRSELAFLEKLMQHRLREKAMANGATLTDPDTVFLAADTKIGRDVTIGPNVVIGNGVEIGNRVEIRAFCHIEQARIEDSAIIGPFARLRPGTVVSAGAHIGNFVELKNTEVGRGAKINHLSYIGDATIGAKANIGAGTITCNYDGFRKHHTSVGANAFIGSNSALVAPVNVGDGAFVAAGSVITMDVPPDTLAVARGRQANIEDWASRFRDGQAGQKKS